MTHEDQQILTHGLIAATKMCHSETAQLLLQSGVTVNEKRADGATALHVASSTGNVDVVSVILAANGRPDGALPSSGDTALIVAVREGYEEIVDLLLKYRANVSIARNCGSTALHVAAMKGHASLVSKLLNAGADANATANDSSSALLYAASLGHANCVQAILSAGCLDKVYYPSKTSGITENGFTALDFALERGGSDIIDMLRNAGAVAPSREPRTLVGARIDIPLKGEARVVDLIDRNMFGITLANSAQEFSVQFASSAQPERVKLLRSDNNGTWFSLLGRLQGSRVALHSDASTSADGIEINVTVSDPGPLQMKLLCRVADSTQQSGIYIFAFAKSAAGKIGPVEACGSIAVGDYLVRVNGTRVPHKMEAAIKLLQQPKPLALTFFRAAKTKRKEISEAEAKSMLQAVLAEQNSEQLVHLLSDGVRLPEEQLQAARQLLQDATRLQVARAGEREQNAQRAVSSASADLERSKMDAVGLGSKISELNLLKEKDTSADDLTRCATQSTDFQQALAMAKKAGSELEDAETKAGSELEACAQAIDELKRALESKQQQLQQHQQDINEIQRERDANHLSSEGLARQMFDNEQRELEARQAAQDVEAAMEERKGLSGGFRDTQARVREQTEALEAARQELKVAVESTAAADTHTEHVNKQIQFLHSVLQDRSTPDVDTTEAVLRVAANSDDFRVQQCSLSVLGELAVNPEVAHWINSRHGQQDLIISNRFRDLLPDEVSQLRHLLSGSRLLAVAEAQAHVSAANAGQNVAVLATVLMQQNVRLELHLQRIGVCSLVQLIDSSVVLSVQDYKASGAVMSNYLSLVDAAEPNTHSVSCNNRNADEKIIKLASRGKQIAELAVQMQEAPRLQAVFQCLTFQPVSVLLSQVALNLLISESGESVIKQGTKDELQNIQEAVLRRLHPEAQDATGASGAEAQSLYRALDVITDAVAHSDFR
jgi:ankyrin repeat protein